MIKHVFSFLIVSFLALIILPKTIHAATYYVAPNGDDTNVGTIDSPLATITKAADNLKPGDTVYVRGGTYNEWVKVYSAGTVENPITIAAYPGETPIIDGTYTIPNTTLGGTDPVTGNEFYWEALVNFRTRSWGEQKTAKHVIFRGFEIKQSLGRGIVITDGADYIKIDDCTIHHNRAEAILAQDVTGTVISNTEVYESSNFAPYPRSSGELNWPGIVFFNGVTNGLMDNLTVYNNWGEGILLGSSTNIVVQNSVVYDNFAVNIYVDHTDTFTLQNNIVYGTGKEPFLRNGKPAPCIALADEPHKEERNANQTIINNFVYGCSTNLAFWYFSGSPDSGLKNALIAHNTLLDAVDHNIKILRGNHSNARITNNIIANPNTEGVLAGVDYNDHLLFTSNLWEEQVDEYVQSTTDIISSNIGVSQTGNTEPGQLKDTYFRLKKGSPAIDAAQDIGVKNDYYANARDTQPDIGAHEYGAGGTTYACGIMFNDMHESHTFYTPIGNLACDRVVNGYEDGNFRPENNVTRAQMAKFIRRAYEFSADTSCGDFPDVPPSHTFYTEIMTLKCNDIIDGFEDNLFRPELEVTRGQAMKFVIEGLRSTKNDRQYLQYTQTQEVFQDVPSDYTFFEHIMAAQSSGIISGYEDGLFQPDNFTTRGAMSKMVDFARGK